MRRLFLLWPFLLLPLLGWAQAATQVVVFTQPSAALDQKFIAEQLPQIQAWCAERGIPLVHRSDPTQGVPKEIGFTPAIVHRSLSGIQVFRGRYVLIEKVFTFLETASLSDSLGEAERQGVALQRQGRVALVGNLKITPTTGDVASMHLDFFPGAREKIAEGLGWAWQEAFTLRSTDRMWYLDVYPHRAGKRLYLSYALFSPFNCHVPIHHSQKPVKGKWKKPDKAFVEVGRRFEGLIVRALSDPSLGDGITPLPSTVPVVAWDQVAPYTSGVNRKSESLGPPITQRTFMYLNDGSKAPALRFAFLPPVQHYAGTISGGSANLKLSEGGKLSGTTGSFTAKMGTLTMGDEGLDEYVHEILRVAQVPEAKLYFSLDGTDATLHQGGTYTFDTKASLDFLGQTTPVPLTLTLEGLDNNRIGVRARFPLLITPFGLEGPDGPSPAAQTLTLLADFTLTPYHKER